MADTLTSEQIASDRRILRELAMRLRDLAADERNAALAGKWRKHNALQHRNDPIVMVSPEGAWGEILPHGSLKCIDRVHQSWEWGLRSRIYQATAIGDDTPVEATLDIPWKLGIGDYGFKVPMTHGDNRGSYVWDPPIKSLTEDLPRMHARSLSVDRDGTAHELQRAQDLLGDLLTVRIRGAQWWTMGLTWDAALLLGLEQLMWAMVDEPENLHRLMAFLRDDARRLIEFTEREGLLSPNTGATDYVGSGGLGAIDSLGDPAGEKPATLAGRWGFAESQETVGVSPAMFEEFILPYQIPLLERFGLNCYGCCEGLEHRIGHVLRAVPRLRRVSVAPLANQTVLAEKLAGQYIYSRKADPTPVCVGFSEDRIRNDLRTTLRLAGDQPLEIILKDTHTVENDPARFGKWVRIAREEIANHYGKTSPVGD